MHLSNIIPGSSFPAFAYSYSLPSQSNLLVNRPALPISKTVGRIRGRPSTSSGISMTTSSSSTTPSSLLIQHATKVASIPPSAATIEDEQGLSISNSGTSTSKKKPLSSKQRRPGPLVDARQLTAVEQKTRFPDADFNVPYRIKDAVHVFFSNVSIQLIVSGLVGLALGRVGAGPLGILDIIALPITVIGWVVQEWAIHRYLLHGFKHWPGYEIHQGHHDLPFYHISIDPPSIVAAWGVVACLIGWAILPSPISWTVLFTYWAMGLLYEWSHFIVHTRVRPSTSLGRAIKAHHTRHHLKDDQYWFAFTWPEIDRLLGTLPPPPTPIKAAATTSTAAAAAATSNTVTTDPSI